MQHPIVRSSADAVDSGRETDHDSPPDVGFWERLAASSVRVDAVPQVHALYRADDWFEDSDDPTSGQTGVVAWVFALPDGKAYVISAESGQRQICVSQSLEHVARFWAANFGADLVAVQTAG